MEMERNRCPECGSAEIIEQRDVYGVSRKICRNCMCKEPTWQDAKDGFKGLVVNPLKSIYNKGVEIETDLTNSIKRKRN